MRRRAKDEPLLGGGWKPSGLEPPGWKPACADEEKTQAKQLSLF